MRKIMRIKYPLVYSKLARYFEERRAADVVSREFRLTKREAVKARKELVELGLLKPIPKKTPGGKQKLRDRVI